MRHVSGVKQQLFYKARSANKKKATRHESIPKADVQQQDLDNLLLLTGVDR